MSDVINEMPKFQIITEDTRNTQRSKKKKIRFVVKENTINENPWTIEILNVFIYKFTLILSFCLNILGNAKICYVLYLFCGMIYSISFFQYKIAGEDTKTHAFYNICFLLCNFGYFLYHLYDEWRQERTRYDHSFEFKIVRIFFTFMMTLLMLCMCNSSVIVRSDSVLR